MQGGVTGTTVSPGYGTAIGAAGGFILGGLGGEEDEEYTQRSNLTPEQQALQDEQVREAHGLFKTAADYHKNNLSNDPEDMRAFAAPELRRFNEDIVPGISEQFAGMGAGGLSSSGFRNAQISASTDLSERLGAIRANLRQNSANAIAGMSQMPLSSNQHDVQTNTGSPGFVESFAPIAGQMAANYAGGGKWGGQKSAGTGGNNVGANSSPYGGGGGIPASPQGGQQLPNFKFSNRGY